MHPLLTCELGHSVAVGNMFVFGVKAEPSPMRTKQIAATWFPLSGGEPEAYHCPHPQATCLVPSTNTVLS